MIKTVGKGHVHPTLKRVTTLTNGRRRNSPLRSWPSKFQQIFPTQKKHAWKRTWYLPISGRLGFAKISISEFQRYLTQWKAIFPDLDVVTNIKWDYFNFYISQISQIFKGPNVLPFLHWPTTRPTTCISLWQLSSSLDAVLFAVYGSNSHGNE